MTTTDVLRLTCDRCGETADFSYQMMGDRQSWRQAEAAGWRTLSWHAPSRPEVYTYRITELCPECGPAVFKDSYQYRSKNV